MSKIAYFDCFSGISGDMIIAALLDCGLQLEVLKAELKKLNLSNYEIKLEKVVKQNISASRFDVIEQGEQVYRHLSDLNQIVEKSKLDEDIKTTAQNIFRKIAEAEAKIHNQSLEKVHFHEIGAVDTIIDVVGALVAIKLLGIERIVCSKLNVGSGFVEFSHGKFPVPAPATAEILKGVPIYTSSAEGELVTPTGAAIITTVANDFSEIIDMKTEAVGYGAGTKDLPQSNVLRVFVGSAITPDDTDQDAIVIIETNIDDMNPQFYDHIMAKLLQNGALDVYLTNILMKKNRPAIKLTVLGNRCDKDKLINTLFQETTSIGVRIRQENRQVLQREMQQVETKYGKVKVKISTLNGEVINCVPEYEDCLKIAKAHNLPLKEVYGEIGNSL
ncbi:MAG: nickel pincer cofactor biosynthesis protein LarC [bacterium]